MLRMATLSLRLLGIFVSCMVLSACWVEVVAPVGGSVESENGFYCYGWADCQGGMISITNTNFDDVFYATPDEGYEFVGWKKRDRGLCGGSSDPCKLSTLQFEGNAGLMSFLDSDEVFYLEAVFEEIGSGSMSCSVYAPGSPYCDEGTYPTCKPTREQILSIQEGMTYEEAVEIAGCHPVLFGWAGESDFSNATYFWGGLTGIPYAELRLDNFTTEVPVVFLRWFYH